MKRNLVLQYHCSPTFEESQGVHHPGQWQANLYGKGKGDTLADSVTVALKKIVGYVYFGLENTLTRISFHWFGKCLSMAKN